MLESASIRASGHACSPTCPMGGHPLAVLAAVPVTVSTACPNTSRGLAIGHACSSPSIPCSHATVVNTDSESADSPVHTQCPHGPPQQHGVQRIPACSKTGARHNYCAGHAIDSRASVCRVQPRLYYSRQPEGREPSAPSHADDGFSDINSVNVLQLRISIA